MPKPTYVGIIEGVVIAGRDPESEPTWVERRVLGVVRGRGIVTSASFDDLRQGIIDGPPSAKGSKKRGKWHKCSHILYERKRRGYSDLKWVHETPGAKVLLWRSGGALCAYIVAPTERRCDMQGDFLCSKDD